MKIEQKQSPIKVYQDVRINIKPILVIALILNFFSFLPSVNMGKLSAQNVGINSTGAVPDASAMLDISSTNKGLLIPRVSLSTTTDIATIPSPTVSLLVYNTNATITGNGANGVGFYYYNGTSWAVMATSGSGGFSHYLGEDFSGGIIFNIYKGSDGLEHGLIVAKTEQVTTQWQSATSLVGANRSWDGSFNTALMINSPAQTYISGLGAGWYLPSINELNMLYNNLFYVNKALNSGGHTLISNTSYWSSTESVSTTAWRFDFQSANIPGATTKTSTYTVRGIKAF